MKCMPLEVEYLHLTVNCQMELPKDGLNNALHDEVFLQYMVERSFSL